MLYLTVKLVAASTTVGISGMGGSWLSTDSCPHAGEGLSPFTSLSWEQMLHAHIPAALPLFIQPCTFSHPIQEFLPWARPELQVLFWLDSCILCCAGTYSNQKPSPKPAWGSSELSAPLCAWRGVGKSRNLAAGCHMSASIPQVRWLHLGYILVNDYDTFRKLNSEQLLTQHVTLLGPVLRLCVNHQEPGFPTKLFRLHAKSRENGVSMAALPLKGPSGSDFFGTWRCSSPLADQVQRHIVLVSKLE